MIATENNTVVPIFIKPPSPNYQMKSYIIKFLGLLVFCNNVFSRTFVLSAEKEGNCVRSLFSIVTFFSIVLILFVHNSQIL